MAKAKPSALREWERRALAVERNVNNEESAADRRPKWNPFLSLEDSELFDDKMKKMRQMRDVGDIGDIMPLRSYEQQVLGAPLIDVQSKKVTAHKGDDSGAEDEEEADGIGKGIYGQSMPLTVPWVTWPHRQTLWKPAVDEDGHAVLTPDPDVSCMAVAYCLQGKTYEYYEAACELEIARNDEDHGRAAGAAGMCFHTRHQHHSLKAYVFYLRFVSGDINHGELVFGKLDDHSPIQTPTEVALLNRKEKLVVNDGRHYFRVRSFQGGLMFYFDYVFVGFVEVEQDAFCKYGRIGVWSFDLEVSIHKVLMNSLEDLELDLEGDHSAAFHDKYSLAKVHHIALKTDRVMRTDVFQMWRTVVRESHAERMAPFQRLEGAEKERARKQMLMAWFSTLHTLQRFTEILTSNEHLQGPRVQRYLQELDSTNPPPPPPPLAPPPSSEDEELHYLYELQQRRYQKQIEHAGRTILGDEKFAELKNMTGGSLAQQQKDLVAQKQKQMAQHSNEESHYQALNKMARRLLSNFGEMDDLVPTMRRLRADRAAAADAPP